MFGSSEEVRFGVLVRVQGRLGFVLGLGLDVDILGNFPSHSQGYFADLRLDDDPS